MILYKVIFGNVGKHKREEAENLVQYYISALLHNGQACGEYFTVLQKGNICAYVNLQGKDANSPQYHCIYGNKWLEKIEDIFGNKPIWKVIDDEIPQTIEDWDQAPFMYLFTRMNDWESPICRGDNGNPVPLYLLPGEHEDREKIYFWQRKYRDYDSIWMGCGELEIPVYKQLAAPGSELGLTGREICAYIEKATGVPTYYYLMRHWGRRKGEDQRACPACGQKWAQAYKAKMNDSPFHAFDFMCEPCRLVSHVSSACDDERHAVIGEWRKGGNGKK